MKRKQYLFCPGPVHVAENVKKASQQDMCHREKEFSQLLSELNNNILELFQIKNKSKYYPVIVTGSSTSGNEAVISSIVGDKHILVIGNGEFGDRISKISKMHNPNTHFLDFGWVNTIDLKKVEEYIKEHKIKVVAMVHHETSTGLLNPIKEVGQIAHKYGALFFVDAVSSVGADPIDIEGSHITFCTTASGKALGSYPGTTIVVGEINEFEKVKNNPQRTTYLYLYNFYKYSKELLQTPNTPNVSGFLALNQAVKNIVNEGIENRINKRNKFATYFRKELGKLGLEPIIKKNMSNVLTTFKVPQGMTPKEIQEKLRERNIIIYAGKGPLKDTVFQVSNIGEIDMDDVNYVVNAFKDILSLNQYTTMGI